jgi:hypothetical protein
VALAASAVAGESAALISETTTYNSGDSIDFIGGGLGEVELYAGTLMGDFQVFLEGPNMGPDLSTVQLAISTTFMMDGVLDALGVGDTVDGSLQYADKAFLVFDTPFAEWTPVTSAYAGFKFEPAVGDTVYGWVEIQYSGGTSLTVTQWAYEEVAGTAIVVPEPSTAVLFALGLAGLAAAARKLRSTSEARGGS